MLYGNDLFIRGLLNDVLQVEKDLDIKVVFGSTIGSISKGLERPSSDYDIRFLFFDKKQKAIFKDNFHIEDKIRYRKYNQSKPYNCIAFWDIFAFINFLTEPIIDRGFNYKLFKNVLNSFQSPYLYDPYGLTAKMLPIISKTIIKEYEIQYNIDILKESYCEGKNVYKIKEIFNILHALLSIRWLRKEKNIAPLNLFPLMTYAHPEEKKKINEIYKRLSQISYLEEDKILLPISEKIIDEIEKAKSIRISKEITSIDDFRKNKEYVNILTNIIQKTLINSTTVKGVT